MSADAHSKLSVVARRRARRLAYRNGALWALGNGLTGTTLVVYLAYQLEVPRIGWAIGLIVAAPQITGLLRLAAPALIGRLADRKRFCLAAYLLSGLVLLGLPAVAAPGCLPSAAASLVALIVLWCVYHLLEYLGTVALWSWLADLVPVRIRGRFLGRRERWMVAGRAVTMLCGGLFAWSWTHTRPESQWWIGYAIPAGLGACLMILAVVPLLGVPRTAASRVVRSGAGLGAMLAPMLDPRFLRLLLFGCWFSFFNGLTQSAQHVYQMRVLGASLFLMLALQTAMRCGQLAVSPWLGRLADRVGNRPVMLGSMPLVASGLLFYLLATPGRWWWLAGAWAVWIAYAGLNVCLPNLLLKLSPGESNTPYIATYYAVTGLCLAASTIAGGTLLDWLGSERFVLFGGALSLDFYRYSFLFGWITRSMGLLVLLLVIEPPGRRS